MSTNYEEESLAWRRQVLEEATRLRSALKDAQKRRALNRTESISADMSLESPASSPVAMSSEMEIFEAAQAKLKRNTTRLEQLRRQVESESTSEEAGHAQLAFLDMAELEMERTRARMKELELESGTDDKEGDSSIADETDSSAPTQQEEEEEEEEEVVPAPKKLVASPMIAAPTEMKKEDPKPAANPPVTREHSGSQDEATWKKLEVDMPPTARTDSTVTKEEPSKSDGPSAADQFARPKPVKKEEVTFDMIKKEMHLTSSPLVFFNLACFHNNADAELDVMLPICGYAVAGRTLCVMGPHGTNTQILRVALSEPPPSPSPAQRQVHVADFTVADLIDVADGIIRPDYLAPSVSLVKHMQLEKVADVQIGTCIQRGSPDGSETLGTPRGSRTPDAPTPRNPQTPRFRGTGAGVQKSVLLMEDLVTVLDAESIFRVLRVLRKVASVKRATVLVTLSKPFERRGLFNLFDDALLFTTDGVSYFGPAKRMRDFCQLIGEPTPSDSHVTDHVARITNAAAKYEESPMKSAVDGVIAEFTSRPPAASDSPPAENTGKKGGMFKKKKRVADEPESEQSIASHRARRLAERLAEERRSQAMLQKSSEKLEVWRRLTELDSHIPKSKEGAKAGDQSLVTNFDRMILQLQSEVKKHRPSCFMNLACFLNMENPDKIPNSVLQPTCAFANEGQLLGVMGPSGSDAANLLASLKISADNTMLTNITVRDTLKLSEFVKHREKSDKLDSSVELVMGKMMLTACSQEVIGVLLQRGFDPTTVPENSMLEIGGQSYSTGIRSILVLDRIHELDAQSVFVVLKLLKRIASSARLSLVLMLQTPEEAEGLFYLLDSILAFSDEGLGYFGAARHFLSYSALVGFPCPEDKHVTAHFREVMKTHAPSEYRPSDTNTSTPFTVRYQFSALSKFYKGVIEISTKSQTDGGVGGATSRTFVPKSFRSKKTARVDEMEAVLEKAEMERQRQYRVQMQKEEEVEKQRRRDAAYEEIWTKLAETDARSSKQPLTAGLKGIVSEMAESQQKPSLFFNLACFLPGIVTERVDMMQPICGYAQVGRIVAIMGPPETDVSAFLRALSGEPAPSPAGDAPLASARSDVRHRVLTVFELLKIAESTRTDRGSQPLHETTKALLINLGLEDMADSRIGTMIQRGVAASDMDMSGGSAVPSILMLDKLSDSLNAQSAFVVLKLVKRIASQAQLSVIVHLPKSTERRGLSTLVDDALLFDLSGVAYFGPANRLKDFLQLIGYEVSADQHETDVTFELLKRYTELDEGGERSATDTPPTVRYKYSPLAAHVQGVVTKYTKPSQNSEYDLQSVRDHKDLGKAGSTFVPKGTRNTFKKKKLGKEEERKRMEDEAALRREEVAEREAEAERMRVAEVDAELVWTRMMQEMGDKAAE